VTSTEFILFAERVKRDHQIAIVPSAKFGQGDEAIFKFRCQRSNIDFLGTARDSLEEWLGQHNVSTCSSRYCKCVDMKHRFRYTLQMLPSGLTRLPMLSHTLTANYLRTGQTVQVRDDQAVPRVANDQQKVMENHLSREDPAQQPLQRI